MLSMLEQVDQGAQAAAGEAHGGGGQPRQVLRDGAHHQEAAAGQHDQEGARPGPGGTRAQGRQGQLRARQEALAQGQR